RPPGLGWLPTTCIAFTADPFCRGGKAADQSSLGQVMVRTGTAFALLRLPDFLLSEYRAEHKGDGEGRQQVLFHLRLARLRHVGRHNAGVMRMVNRFPDAHLLQVILELFAAVQTHNVALAVALA